MKIPEWLPDTRQPVRPEGGAPMPMIARLTDPFIRFFQVEAAGGLVLPAAIYLLMEHGRPGADGWAIPMATGIAFVMGFLALLGKRVPFSLKILLLTLAIIDDLGAVLVIAGAFTERISPPMLGLAGSAFSAVLGSTLLWWFLKKGVAGGDVN